jgi:hypothetical protein
MVMRGHQTISQVIHMLAQIFLNPTQKIQIVVTLKDHGLTIVAAIVEVIIQVW